MISRRHGRWRVATSAAAALIVLTSMFVAPGATAAPSAPTQGAADSDPLTVAGSRYVTTAPTRVLDTRRGLPGGVQRLGPSGELTLDLVNDAGVPADASAVVLNLTATGNGGPGFVSVWPTGVERPTVSSLNLTEAFQTRANLVIVEVGVGGAIDLYASAGAHLIADLAGYFVPDAIDPDGRFTPLDPSRLLDTRNGVGASAVGKVSAKGTIELQVAGRGGVPLQGATAVALNVTLVEAAAAGYVTVWPGGSEQPLASNLNADEAGDTVPNATIVPLGPDGTIEIYTQAAADLVVDATGWFGVNGAAGAVGLFVPVTPARIADSRSVLGLRPLPRNRRVDLTVGGHGEIPSAVASAAVMNLTSTESERAGFVTAHPTGSVRPNASILNPDVDDTRAGLTLARLGDADRISLYSSSATDIVADVSGFFIGTPRAPDPGVPLDTLEVDLDLDLDPILDSPSLAGAATTATVWVEGHGVVYAHSPDLALIPASNQKLFTAVGALSYLSPDTSLVTTMGHDGSGDLFFTAAGDPTLTRSDLRNMAADVASAGITAVPGDLIVDVTRHEALGLLPGWEWLDPWDAGPLSAFMLDDNQYRTDPAYFADPVGINAAELRAALATAGIEVDGLVRYGSVSAGATTVASHTSPTMSELMATLVTKSDNEVAEILVREVGLAAAGTGSTEAGLAEIAAILEELDVGAPTATDGSGLSNQNRASSAQIVDLLVALRGTDVGDRLGDVLPRAGETGTLRLRLGDSPTRGNVRAKTGTLENSRALSGYLELLDGTDVVFSIIVNAPNASPARAVIDDWVSELASR